MNYQQTIEYLYAQLPMFSRIGSAAYKADLTNTIALCKAINHPENKFKSIHIAGTNGKGSTSHMLAAVLQSAGYKTGLYTSPHLKDFRERIRINGQMIPEQQVVDFVATIKTTSEAIEPSFFELTVAMAFDYFAQEQVDVAVIETGLGGRLDSTNVITPLVSVITNIGYDHMNLLGDTLPLIAAEKAGIIKPQIPVVLGQTLPETLPVFFNKAAECKAPVTLASDVYQVDAATTLSNGLLQCNLTEVASQQTKSYQLQLSGLYQVNNLRSVLVTLNLLKQQGFIIPDAAIDTGLANTTTLTALHGRWEKVASNPTIILDVAHNEDGIRQVLNQLQQLPASASVHLVMGMVKDKDVNKVLGLLPTNAAYYFTQANLPRALPAADLQAMAAQFQLQGEVYENVNVAIAAAKQVAQPNDYIIVCGSVFLVGEVAIDLL